jgi:predicted DNA-binding WGR domain protein
MFHPQHVYLMRHDISLNMARFYEIEIDTDLFGEIVLRRRWGRIGTQGQGRMHVCRTEQDAQTLLGELQARKVRRGYRL